MDGEAMRREPSDADLGRYGWSRGNFTFMCQECRGREWHADELSLCCRPCAVRRWKLANTPEAGEVRQDRQNGTDGVGATPNPTRAVVAETMARAREENAFLRETLRQRQTSAGTPDPHPLPNPTGDEIREAIARAICMASGFDPDHNYDPKGLTGPDGLSFRWRLFLPHADAILPLLHSQTAKERVRAEVAERISNGWEDYGNRMRARAEEAERERDEAVRALKPFVERAAHLEPDWLPHESHWYPSVGSPVTVGDLRKAREVYRTLSKTREKTHDA